MAPIQSYLVERSDRPGRSHTVARWRGYATLLAHYRAFVSSFKTIPENRVYVSPERTAQFVKSFLDFSHGQLVSDVDPAPGIEIGRHSETFRRIRIKSGFGLLTVFVTDGTFRIPTAAKSRATRFLTSTKPLRRRRPRESRF